MPEMLNHLLGSIPCPACFLGSELNQEISSPLRQEFQVAYFLPLESSDHTAFEAFKRDRLKLEDGGNRVGSNKRVIVSKSHEGAISRASSRASRSISRCAPPSMDSLNVIRRS